MTRSGLIEQINKIDLGEFFVTETLSAALPELLERRVHAVLKAACDREIRLATAESCTGGLVASVLTDVDGCGRAFDRGFVVYTDAAKHALLGVPEQLLRDAGAVSMQVAIAMAEGALARSEADLAVAVTGFAGPGGPGDTPGLVHFGLARLAGPTLHRMERFQPTNRGSVRIAALDTAIAMLAEALAAA